MLRLLGFGIRNLRSLRDTGLIDLKPITILVGKNSSGKSSFARVLPLLKQSAERRKQAPLLWFGRLVDFGSFDEAVSTAAEPREITLLLRFSSPDALYLNTRSGTPEVPEVDTSSTYIDVTLTIGSAADDERTVLRRLMIEAFELKMSIDLNDPRQPKVMVGTLSPTIASDAFVALLTGAILPQLHLIYRDVASAAPISDAAFFRPLMREEIGTPELREAISAFVHGNTLPERKDEIGARLPIATLSALMAHCRHLSGVPYTWKANLEYVGNPASSTSFRRLHEALGLFNFGALLRRLDEALQSFCDGVSYLEPLRATAQRYYRREEISINELDPKGLNTVFFVQGLSTRERESLSSWLRKTFGFTLSVKATAGHASLNIEVGSDGQSRNMADVGLGYSQVVPVAIQLWAAQRRLENRGRVLQRGRVPARRRPSSDLRSIVVIEQPELHLHPAYQAQLADVFAMCASRSGPTEEMSEVSRMEIVAETHSASLINRLGELVGEGRLGVDDIEILVFEPEAKDSTMTAVRIARFDEKGVLTNWPIGFFEY